MRPDRRAPSTGTLVGVVLLVERTSGGGTALAGALVLALARLGVGAGANGELLLGGGDVLVLALPGLEHGLLQSTAVREGKGPRLRSKSGNKGEGEAVVRVSSSSLGGRRHGGGSRQASPSAHQTHNRKVIGYRQFGNAFETLQLRSLNVSSVAAGGGRTNHGGWEQKDKHSFPATFSRPRFRSGDLWVMGPARFLCASLLEQITTAVADRATKLLCDEDEGWKKIEE